MFPHLHADETILGGVSSAMFPSVQGFNPLVFFGIISLKLFLLLLLLLLNFILLSF